jgi:tetratricopeptide (TPR) repeat protein
LWSLLKHRSEDVRDWALTRLLDLYPEAQADLLQTLPQATSEAASSILSRFQGVECPPELHTFFQRTTVPFLKARAAALLIRAGHELPAQQLAAVNLSPVLDLLADTAPGFDFLLQRYRSTDTEEESLVHAMSLACGSAEIMTLLHDESGKKARRKVLQALGDAWGCDLSDLRNVRYGHEAVQALEQALAVMPEASPAPAPWQQELCHALAHDRQRLAAFAEAAHVHLSRAAASAPADIDLLLSCTLALRRDACCRRLLLGARDMTEVWHALVLRPWHAAVGPDVVNFLGSQEPAEVVDALRQALGRPYAYADFPFAILNALDTPGRFDLFLEAYQGAFEEQFIDEGEKALRAGGPLAASAVVEHFRRHLPEPMSLFVLAMLPTPEVEEFLVGHWEHYMGHAWSRYFVEVLELVASERFFPLLLDEWREGEAIMGRAIILIAAVHGVQHTELRRIRRDTEKHERAFKRFQARASKDPARALQDMLEREGPLHVPLRCTACSRTYHYDVKTVYVNPKRAHEYHMGQIIQCKRCDSLETYEVTPATQMTVGAEIMRLGLLVELDKRQGGGSKPTRRPDTPIVAQKLRLMAAGRYFDSIRDAYRFLKDKIAEDPTNGELHRRLGNVLKNGARPDLALPVYFEAIRLDPNEAEAYYNIVELLLEQEQYREAIPYLETLIRLCREGDMAEKLRRDIFASLLEQVVVVEHKTGQRLDLFPVPAPADVSAVASDTDQTPPVVYLRSFDLSDPDDFERMYHVFRTGRVPDETPRRGLSSWLSRTSTPEAALQTRQLPASPVRTAQAKVGRNAPCPCGSGRKYKRCCGR